MAYLLALSSAALYGAADFLDGLAYRRSGGIEPTRGGKGAPAGGTRANTLAIVVTSQGCGLTLLVLSLPLLPEATPAARDFLLGRAERTPSPSSGRRPTLRSLPLLPRMPRRLVWAARPDWPMASG